jgi:hypothetical protein
MLPSLHSLLLTWMPLLRLCSCWRRCECKRGGRGLQLQGKDTELDNGHSLGKKQISIAEQWGEKLLLS